MFDFMFQNKKEELQSLIELITINATKAAISDLALEKAANMIAKAIAKSEFVVSRKNLKTKDDVYWMLNVQPNPNETATEFWIASIRKLLMERECLIVHVNGKLFRAKSFQADGAVVKGKKYTHVNIEVKDDSVELQRTFKAEDVIHLVNPNEKIKKYLDKNLGMYNTVASGLLSARKLSSIPKFTLNVEGGLPVIKRKKEDGTETILTVDKYKEEIKKLLESENIEVLVNQNGLSTSQLSVSTGVTSEDITKISNEIYTECAYAFDIPKAVFLGEITEKADSTNEFITYGVNWLVEMLNDSMNMALVGKDAYLKDEKIWIDMSKYKHVDVIESAGNLDKLRAIGFTLDEIFEMVGWQPLNTEFSKQRVLTKNYTNELGGGESAQKST